jgi:hypothetical protein
MSAMSVQRMLTHQATVIAWVAVVAALPAASETFHLSGGLSRNHAAKQFGIGISPAMGWVRRLRETGSVAPGKMGGHRPKAISGEHRVWLLQRINDRDFTLPCHRRNAPSLHAGRMRQIHRKLRL